MPPARLAPVGNRLLASLPRRKREGVLAGCQSVELRFGEILAEAGEDIRYLYFPTASFISLTTSTDAGRRAEVGLVGSEGMLGATLILGVDSTPLQALVQGSGAALRIGAAAFRREVAGSPALERVIRRYLYVLLKQLAQTSACTHFHMIEARLARWLLMTQDRAHSDQFYVTQEFLALMLGVRRVGVTKAAGALQRRHLISYRRGDIIVLDRKGLETASCGCYEVDRATYTRIMD